MCLAKLVIAHTEEEEQACIILLALRLCVTAKREFISHIQSPDNSNIKYHKIKDLPNNSESSYQYYP